MELFEYGNNAAEKVLGSISINLKDLCLDHTMFIAFFFLYDLTPPAFFLKKRRSMSLVYRFVPFNLPKSELRSHRLSSPLNGNCIISPGFTITQRAFT